MFANQVLAEANKRGVSIDGVLKASDIKFENGKIYMQAGKEIIAETPVVEEVVSAKIAEEENTEIVNQTTESDYSKRKKEAAYSILSRATGKSKKWLRMQLGSKSDKKGMAKRREFIEELISNTADGITVNDGFLPEWADFYSDTGVSYNNDKLGGDYELAMQALNDILNDNFEDPVQAANEYWNDYAESIKKDFEELISKMDNANTIEDIEKIDELLEITPEDVLNYNHDEFENAYANMYNRIFEGDNINGNSQNSSSNNETENEGTSGANLRTTQENSNTSTQRNYQNGRTETSQEITPDTKLNQMKNSPKQNKKKKIILGQFDYVEKTIEIFKKADYSTLPHELAHYWLDNMWGYYRSGKASEAYKNNFKGVLDWLGVDEESQTYFTDPQQEKFADGYLKYLKNGYAPNGLIQGAVDDYDKWLENLYNGAKKLKVKLTPDAIEFFDTMTTGELPEYALNPLTSNDESYGLEVPLGYDVPETQAQIREKNIEQMNKDIETARKFVVARQAEYNNFDGGNVITKDTVPVTTEGEKKQSKAYTNQASILGIAEELNYNKVDIAEQNKLASEYVKNNLDEARQIVNGQKEAPSDILKNAIYNAYLKEMLAIGDNDAYVRKTKDDLKVLMISGNMLCNS